MVHNLRVAAAFSWSRPLLCNQLGDSTMAGLMSSCATDNAAENSSTARHS